MSWYVGYFLAVVVSYAAPRDARVPALADQPGGRADLAEQIVDCRLGTGYDAREQLGAESEAEGGLRVLLRGENRRG